MITREGSEGFRDFEKFCVGEGQSWSVGQPHLRLVEGCTATYREASHNWLYVHVM